MLLSIYEYFQGVIDAFLVTSELQNRQFRSRKTHVLRDFCPDLQVFSTCQTETILRNDGLFLGSIRPTEWRLTIVRTVHDTGPQIIWGVTWGREVTCC